MLLTLAHFGTSICFFSFLDSHHFSAPPLLLFPLSIFWLTFSILQQATSAANPRAASMMYIQPSAVTKCQQIRTGQLGIFLMLVISKSGGLQIMILKKRNGISWGSWEKMKLICVTSIIVEIAKDWTRDIMLFNRVTLHIVVLFISVTCIWIWPRPQLFTPFVLANLSASSYKSPFELSLLQTLLLFLFPSYWQSVERSQLWNFNCVLRSSSRSPRGGRR